MMIAGMRRAFLRTSSRAPCVAQHHPVRRKLESSIDIVSERPDPGLCLQIAGHRTTNIDSHLLFTARVVAVQVADESPEIAVNLPLPGEIAAEIVEDLQAALDPLAEITADLTAREAARSSV